MFKELWKFIFIVIIVWVFLFAVDSMLPGIKTGADQIYLEKLRNLRKGALFPEDAPHRLVVFGTSKILSGFVPDYFDELSGGRIVSYNMGIPDATHFIDELETLVNRGQSPSHVFLTSCWNLEAAPTFMDKLKDDQWIMEKLFPFRKLIRNVVLFFLRSLSRGGPTAYYRKGLYNIDRMLADRGYHFIESQSHYPGHRLPENFKLDTDHPDQPQDYRSECRPCGPVFQRLKQLQSREGFKIYIVPIYVREYQAAPAESNRDLKEMLSAYDIQVIGPDYFVLPNRLFSDPVHLNPEGAHIYTKLLWETFQPFWDRPTLGKSPQHFQPPKS